MTSEDIERILMLIDHYHSLSYAQEVAEARARQGFALLAAALDDLPCRAAVTELLTVLRSLASRST
jgi:hypothetical protein